MGEYRTDEMLSKGGDEMNIWSSGWSEYGIERRGDLDTVPDIVVKKLLPTN